MSVYKTDSIVIVGGGTAGWMTAATLIKAFPNKKITLIESPDIKVIGVGESTSAEFKDWLMFLDIDLKEFLIDSEANYKFATKYVNWYTEDKSIYFTPMGFFENEKQKTEEWQIKNLFDEKNDKSDYFQDYYSQGPISFNNKAFNVEEPFLHKKPKNIEFSFQINAVKFAKYLAEKYCIPRGVERILSEVQNINGSENGINSLNLKNGQEIFGDLYIDCTGFKSLLLGQFLKEEFESCSNVLPNNKAYFAPYQYTNKEKELETYTTATALKNGWTWNTPLWSRVGTGYSFSNEFTDEDSALQEFKNHLDSEKMPVYNPNRSKEMEFNLINVKNGFYKNTWKKNVIAIGLSAGFYDPLEASGIFMIQLPATQLLIYLKNKFVSDVDIQVFNKKINNEKKELLFSVEVNYILSKRNDSEYWNKHTSKNISEDTLERLTKFVELQDLSQLGPSVANTFVGMNFGLKSLYSIININNYNYDSFEEKKKQSMDSKKYHRALFKDLEYFESHYKWMKRSVYGEYN